MVLDIPLGAARDDDNILDVSLVLSTGIRVLWRAGTEYPEESTQIRSLFHFPLFGRSAWRLGLGI